MNEHSVQRARGFSAGTTDGDGEVEPKFSRPDSDTSTGVLSAAEANVFLGTPTPTPKSNVVIVAQAGQGDATVREIQQRLNALGFDAGPVDGLVGRRTRDAIRAWERSQGRRVTGAPDPGVLSALRSNAGAPTARVPGEPTTQPSGEGEPPAAVAYFHSPFTTDGLPRERVDYASNVYAYCRGDWRASSTVDCACLAREAALDTSRDGNAAYEDYLEKRSFDSDRDVVGYIRNGASEYPSCSSLNNIYVKTVQSCINTESVTPEDVRGGPTVSEYCGCVADLEVREWELGLADPQSDFVGKWRFGGRTLSAIRRDVRRECTRDPNQQMDERLKWRERWLIPSATQKPAAAVEARESTSAQPDAAPLPFSQHAINTLVFAETDLHVTDAQFDDWLYERTQGLLRDASSQLENVQRRIADAEDFNPVENWEDLTVSERHGEEALPLDYRTLYSTKHERPLVPRPISYEEIRRKDDPDLTVRYFDFLLGRTDDPSFLADVIGPVDGSHIAVAYFTLFDVTEIIDDADLPFVALDRQELLLAFAKDAGAHIGRHFEMGFRFNVDIDPRSARIGADGPFRGLELIEHQAFDDAPYDGCCPDLLPAATKDMPWKYPLHDMGRGITRGERSIRGEVTADIWLVGDDYRFDHQIRWHETANGRVPIQRVAAKIVIEKPYGADIIEDAFGIGNAALDAATGADLVVALDRPLDAEKLTLSAEDLQAVAQATGNRGQAMIALTLEIDRIDRADRSANVDLDAPFVIMANVTDVAITTTRGDRLVLLTPAHLGAQRAEAYVTPPPDPDVSVRPPSEGAAFSPETADLLQLRHLPAAVDDVRLKRMMRSRLAYERAHRFEPTRLDWGSFFAPFAGEMSEALFDSLAPAFRTWSVARAEALPQTFVLRLPTDVLDPLEGKNYDTRLTRICDRDREPAQMAEAIAARCAFLSEAAQIPEGVIYAFDAMRLPRSAVGLRTGCFDVDDRYEAYCEEIDDARDALGLPETHDLLAVPRFPNMREFDNRDLVLEVTLVPRTVIRASEPMPSLWVSMVAAANAYSGRVGLSPLSIGAQSPPDVPQFVFEADVRSARLLDEHTEEVVEDLPLVDIEDAIKSLAEDHPLMTRDAPDPFAHSADVAGVHLGQAFDEAEAAIRARMDVGTTLVAEPDPMKATAGLIQPFASGKLFVSRDGSETIAIFDEPRVSAEEVVGVYRIQRLPYGSVDPDSLAAHLARRHGEPRAANHEAMHGGNAITLTFAGLPLGNENCHEMEVDYWTQSGWRMQDGQPWQPSDLTLSEPVLLHAYTAKAARENKNPNILCPARLVTRFLRAPAGGVPARDEIMTMLVDQRGYFERLIAALGDAQTSASAGAL